MIRLYRQNHSIERRVIVNLKTVKNMRGIDMWLSQPDRPLDKLRFGDVLEPIYARKWSITSGLVISKNMEQNISLEDF